MSRTKIVCTIGPASRSEEVLEKMMRAGLDVVRINFSHGTHEEHGEVIRRVREIARRLGRPIAILQDIAGPKIRIGEIAGGSVVLETGQDFVLTEQDGVGDKERVAVHFHGLAKVVHVGDGLLLSDGALELEVVRIDGVDIHCRVVNGGVLSSRKGVNLPSRSTGIPILNDKDRADILFGLQQGVDYIGLSFVRTADDVAEVRAYIESLGFKDVHLVAKIEKPEALANIDAIIAAVDAVMVARGDLGVEIPFERVPLAQMMIIRKANLAGRPVITATQMMASMVSSPRPTRAEVTDVASAIFDGTDAVMLSEETAMGAYPVTAVEAMERVARETEEYIPYRKWAWLVDEEQLHSAKTDESVARAACSLAEDIEAKAIVAVTTTGNTARLVAKFRPPRTIIVPTANEKTYRRLAMVYGVEPYLVDRDTKVDELVQVICQRAMISGIVKEGDRVVLVTSGVLFDEAESTSYIRTWTVQT